MVQNIIVFIIIMIAVYIAINKAIKFSKEDTSCCGACSKRNECKGHK